jgi:hypothetical protein
MTRYLLAGAAVFSMLSGAAMAQSSGHSSTTEETTTITPAALPPVTTSSSSTTGRGATADGDQTSTAGTSSTDANGVRTETVVTNKSYPLTNMITTTRTTTVTNNGVATETVTTTNTYPAAEKNPPETTSVTRVYIVGAK